VIFIRILDGKINSIDNLKTLVLSSEVIPPLSPPDACGEGRAELEVLLSNLCHLDQVLDVIKEQVSSKDQE
jgi:hypothetical protein